MLKARRAEIWVVPRPHRLPYDIGQFMVQDECGAEVASQPAASRYPGKNRLAGRMAGLTDQGGVFVTG